MARGFGLRPRLVSGGRGGNSDLPLWMNLGQQLAQAVGPEDPDIAQARQLQQAKIQEIQLKTQAQQTAMQADAEDQAQYNQLAERMFPSGGRTVTETGPPQIETEPGDIPVGNQLTERNQPLTDNELLLRQLVRSRNQKILQNIALQQQQESPSGPPPVYDIGGGHQVIQQPGGNYAFVPRNPKEPADKTLNPNDLAAFVSSGGALRGPSIPPDMTPEQGKATLNNIRSIAQQHINIQQQNLQDKPAPKGTYVAANGDVNPVFSMSDAHQHINSGGVFLPQGSPSEKVKSGSDLFDTHINGALDMYEASPEANKGGRVSSYLKNSWQVYANDPAKVALFQFYGAATPFATSSVYNSMTGGRGSALMAMMLDPTGIEKGDNDATGLNKLYVGESLAREAAIKRGIPTAPYDKTINRIQSIAKRRNVQLLQQFGTGGKSSVTLGGQTYTRD